MYEIMYLYLFYVVKAFECVRYYLTYLVVKLSAVITHSMMKA